MLNDWRYLGVSLFDAGGMARDVLLAEIPIVLRAELYAVAALAAATDAIWPYSFAPPAWRHFDAKRSSAAPSEPLR